MTINLKVPSIVCDACATAVTKAIVTQEPEAKVDINISTKEVTVETSASEASIRQAIVAAGHTVES
jgi:copper chaperone